jgi:AmmeMemoRadiSam system protein B
VPHAGWICSGAIAGQALAALAQARKNVDVVVVFGAIHLPLPTSLGVLDTHASWSIPGGQLALPDDLQQSLLEHGDLFAIDERFHRREHAVEVELPLIRQAWPSAGVLPVEVPPIDAATDIGRSTARALARGGLRAVYLASSDLTHYGPGYAFTPAGVGKQGLAWARDNDQRLLDVVMDMAPHRVVPEVASHHNACGAGAIAAMMAACLESGATQARVLRHANSYETLLEVVARPSPTDAVGYAAVVIG